jgi:hypothetical protein
MRRVFGWVFIACACATWALSEWPVPEAVSPIESRLARLGIPFGGSLALEVALIAGFAVLGAVLLRRPR